MYRLRELFLLHSVLDEFKSWIIDADFSELGDPHYTGYVHIGFFNLYRASGGGIAARLTEKVKLPIIIVNRSESVNDYVATLAHELLHTMGAGHSRGGIMNPSYPINTGFFG